MRGPMCQKDPGMCLVVVGMIGIAKDPHLTKSNHPGSPTSFKTRYHIPTALCWLRLSDRASSPCEDGQPS